MPNTNSKTSFKLRAKSRWLDFLKRCQTGEESTDDLFGNEFEFYFYSLNKKERSSFMNSLKQAFEKVLAERV